VKNLIPLTDRERIKEISPFSLSTLYKMRCIGQYPDLTVKVGGKVCLNLDALDKMVEESLEKQRVKSLKLQKIRNEL